MIKTLLTLFLTSVVINTAQGQVRQQKPDPKATAATTAAAALPTVDQIIEKYLRAVGGEEAFSKFSTLISKGTVEIPGVPGTGKVEEYHKSPNKMMVKMTLPALGLINYGYDGKSGWKSDPSTGLVDVSGKELVYMIFDSKFNAEIKLKERYPKLELKGVQKVNDRDAYLIIGTPADLKPEKLYFDTQSGFLVRLDVTRESAAGEQLSEIYLEDYQEVDGVKVPFTQRVQSSGVTLVLKYESVKFNLPLDDSTFSKPKFK